MGQTPHSPRSQHSVSQAPIPNPPGNDIIQRLVEHESAFRTFLRRRVGDDAPAEDLLQQSFIKAVERQHSLRNDENAVAWFYRVLRNALIDYYRSQGAEARRNEAFLQELTVSGDDHEPPIDEVKTAA
jgi:RNA polymerase sigma-70 factor (ECF subfamily)